MKKIVKINPDKFKVVSVYWIPAGAYDLPGYVVYLEKEDTPGYRYEARIYSIKHNEEWEVNADTKNIK